MSNSKKEKIVIVGYGWVGQANALALTRMGYDVFYYDVVTPSAHYTAIYSELYERVHPLTTLLEKDDPTTWYIVSIGDRVSPEGEQDISLIERALVMLAPTQGKIILRSTVLPQYLANLRFHYYFPEFLHEIKAVEECLNPYYYVLGKRAEEALPSFLKEWAERAHKVFIGTPEEAAHIKYLSNIWNALRIGFVNEFGDSIARPVNAAKRQEIERVLDFILERKSYLRYGQGFGGHCLPKDLRAYTAWKRQAQQVTPILGALLESNVHHEEVGRTYQNLPQWFSFWDYQGRGVRPVVTLVRWWRKFNNSKTVQRLRHALQPLRRAAESVWPSKNLSQAKQAWNLWAEKNAYFYAHPDTRSGRRVDEFEVRQSGEEDYHTYLQADAVLHELLGEFKARTALEIGTGVGRMTEYLAKDFGKVYGVEISPVMLTVAQKRLNMFPNITLLENAGNDLPVGAEQVDLVFSHLTFRHLSNPGVIQEYALEIARVLKRGGVAKIQLRTGPEVYRWRWFHGVSFQPDEARRLFEQVGLVVLEIKQENAKSLWVTAKKL